MIVKTLKNSTRFECDNWKGIYVLPVIAKLIPKIILGRMKEDLETLIDRKQAGFRPESSCIHHINTQRITPEQCAEFTSSLELDVARHPPNSNQQ